MPQSEVAHIGNSIKQSLKNNDRSMAWLAKKVHCDRSNFAKKLHNNSIDISLLHRICEVLHEDFFAQCSTSLCGKNTAQND
ncbi:MAG: XRE family transcriptional regulator [Bacteroidales bacterium]|nr:XRE family transcriptional regulator [Bacteroidales bacterium]